MVQNMMYKNLNLYCSDTNADNIIKHYDSIDKINDLSYIEIEKGIVHPFKLNEGIAPYFGGWYGGVSDREFNIIDEGCLYWENNSLACGKVYRKQIDEYIDKEVIFLGLYMGHFGHCITDGLNRLWFLLKNNSINNYCYISQVDKIFDALLPCIPIIPVFNLCSEGIAPLRINVVATGAFIFSAKLINSSVASEFITPPPA